MAPLSLQLSFYLFFLKSHVIRGLSFPFSCSGHSFSINDAFLLSFTMPVLLTSESTRKNTHTPSTLMTLFPFFPFKITATIPFNFQNFNSSNTVFPLRVSGREILSNFCLSVSKLSFLNFSVHTYLITFRLSLNVYQGIHLAKVDICWILLFLFLKLNRITSRLLTASSTFWEIIRYST